MERTTVTQNSEGRGFRKSPQRNLPEQKTRRYAVGWKAGGGGRGGLVRASTTFQNKGGSFAGSVAPSQGKNHKRRSAREEKTAAQNSDILSEPWRLSIEIFEPVLDPVEEAPEPKDQEGRIFESGRKKRVSLNLGIV